MLGSKGLLPPTDVHELLRSKLLPQFCKHSESVDLLHKSLLPHVWRVPSSKALSCKHERLFDLLTLASLLLIYYTGMWIFCQYKKYAVDAISLVVTVIMLTLLIFGGAWIKSVLNQNLILIFLLMQGTYLVIRWYIHGCRISRGH